MKPPAAAARAPQTRSILHVDMDAFYVGVELRRHPELRGKPVVVGGTGARGVIAAASYEARRFGVHSALPSVVARRRCPHAVFLSGDHALYASVSVQVHEIFHSVTPLVEPLALDEAFLDVTGALRRGGTAAEIGHRIRARVKAELDLDCCVGGSSAKFIAKMASKGAKPKVTPTEILPGPGVLMIEPGTELAYLHPQPVQALWGVGPSTLDRLARLGIRTIGDLAAISVDSLVAAVGQSHGRHLHDLAWAIDDRPVEPDREMKSIGHEETFAQDRYSYDDLHREAVRLADAVASRLRAHGGGARTVTMKVRFADFTTITRSVTVPSPIHTAHAILVAVEPSMREVDIDRGIRLLGVSVSNFGEVTEQLSFDDLLDPTAAAPEQEWSAASVMMDAIREKFGVAAIGPASAVGADGLRLMRSGQQQWGPDSPREAGIGRRPDPKGP